MLLSILFILGLIVAVVLFILSIIFDWIDFGIPISFVLVFLFAAFSFFVTTNVAHISYPITKVEKTSVDVLFFYAGNTEPYRSELIRDMNAADTAKILYYRERMDAIGIKLDHEYSLTPFN